MGAPKQKWTAEEEAALRAGVRKHGAGKWQLILRDPSFKDILISRSNVDLKDKWRNINVTLSGFGSREKARLALKKNPQLPKLDDKVTIVNNVKLDEKALETKPIFPNETSQVADSKKTYTRLDSVVLEAVIALKEPKGSDRDAIAMYIEEHYQVKHGYKISTNLPSSVTKRSSSPEHKLMTPPRNEPKIFTRTEVVADLKKMRSMSAQEAAATAAQAVAEAEAALAEAEKAAREAEAAEAEAEAAQVFAEATMKALRCHQLRAC